MKIVVSWHFFFGLLAGWPLPCGRDGRVLPPEWLRRVSGRPLSRCRTACFAARTASPPLSFFVNMLAYSALRLPLFSRVSSSFFFLTCSGRCFPHAGFNIFRFLVHARELSLAFLPGLQCRCGRLRLPLPPLPGEGCVVLLKKMWRKVGYCGVKYVSLAPDSFS